VPLSELQTNHLRPECRDFSLHSAWQWRGVLVIFAIGAPIVAQTWALPEANQTGLTKSQGHLTVQCLLTSLSVKTVPGRAAVFPREMKRHAFFPPFRKRGPPPAIF